MVDEREDSVNGRLGCMGMGSVDNVRVSTLVDNDVLRSGLRSVWDLSLYVEVFLGGVVPWS